MVRYALVWVVGALVSGLSVWSLSVAPAPDPRPEQHGRPPGETPGRARSNPAELTEGPRALNDCREELAQKEAHLKKVRAAEAEALARRGEDDEARAAIGAEVGDETRAAAGEEPATASEARQRTEAAAENFDESLLAELEVTGEERRAVRDLVCPLRDNQRSLYLEFASGALDAQALFRALGAERTTSNDGLRRSLGADRFRKLRQVGAMAILARRLCGRR